MISKPKSKYSAREWAYIKAAYKRTVPFALCFLLLLTVGFLYIANYGKGIGYAFCYTFLPVIAGALTSLLFKKIQLQKHIIQSSGKIKATYLAFFTLHILIMCLWDTAHKFAPQLLLVYIPVVYALYVSVIPSERIIIKAASCLLFLAGMITLSIMRPTVYAGDGLFVLLLSLFCTSIIAIKNDRFGYNNKCINYAIAVILFASIYFILRAVTYITPLYSIISSFADISPVSAAEVMQNIGLVPMLLICALHLATIAFSFILATGKSYIFKHITVAVTTVFSVAFLLSLLTAAGYLYTNFGLPFLECTELSTAFILMYTLIILDSNKDDISVHALTDSVLYQSLYTGKFRDESCYKGRLLIVQGSSGYSKTQYLSEITDNESAPVLVFTMEAVYARLIQTLRDHSVHISNSPELVFPEIVGASVSLMLIEDVDMIPSDKTAIQAEFAQLLNTLMIDRGISIVITGIDLRQRVPALWDGLTNPNNERFCGSVSYVDL